MFFNNRPSRAAISQAVVPKRKIRAEQTTPEGKAKERAMEVSKTAAKFIKGADLWSVTSKDSVHTISLATGLQQMRHRSAATQKQVGEIALRAEIATSDVDSVNRSADSLEKLVNDGRKLITTIKKGLLNETAITGEEFTLPDKVA